MTPPRIEVLPSGSAPFPIPYARQDVDEADIEAVVAVLRSEWLTQGPAIDRFERAVGDYCGARYGVAVSSATAGLHLGCLALGLGPGDWLWTSANTFVASANCGLYCGAQVDFVDIDPRTYNLSVEHLAARLARAEKENRLPRIVVPVHFAGQSCPMAEIAALGKRYGFKILEDASHAIGGRYQEKAVGDCRYSDLAVFSFHPVKIITTGEGGMIMTNREDLYERLRRLRTHGITRDSKLMEHPDDGPWYYEQLELGYNYRITDIQAALGVSQMTRLDEFVARRHHLASRYDEALAGLPVRVPEQQRDVYSAFHLYVIRLRRDGARSRHRAVFEGLRAAGIGVNLHYIPAHLQPFYRRLGFEPGDFPEAEKYYGEAITLPLYPNLDEARQDQVVAVLKKLL